jgi:hypothetical protein
MAKVNDGDCILSIAKTLGIRDYKTLWAVNTALQTTCPNPNMLVADATVVEPPKAKVEVKSTAKRWTFVVADTHPATLQIVLLGSNSTPLAGAEWALSEPVDKSGTTGTDGLIKIEALPVDAKKGVLKVTPKAAAPVTASPTTATTSSPPPYPAPIMAADFKDPVRAGDPSDAFVEWELKIGSLGSHKDDAGVWARLDNLGASCAGGTRGAASVKAYQRAFLNQKTGSGVPADIQEDLRVRHDQKP